jgi:hypothetical protein
VLACDGLGCHNSRALVLPRVKDVPEFARRQREVSGACGDLGLAAGELSAPSFVVNLKLRREMRSLDEEDYTGERTGSRVFLEVLVVGAKYAEFGSPGVQEIG